MSLTARELSKMRDVQDVFMPDTCTIKRPTYTKNESGSQSITWTDVYTDLPCEVTSKVLRQIIEHIGGGSINSGVRWNVTVPYGTVIELDDKIYVNSSNGTQIYQVNGVQSVESYETAVVAQCLRVE